MKGASDGRNGVIRDKVYAKALTLVVCGVIDIGIMVVTWKSGAPYGWAVFEGILSLFAAAGLAGD